MNHENIRENLKDEATEDAGIIQKMFTQVFSITKDWYSILYLCNRNLSISRFYITIWMRDTFQFFSTKVQLLIQELLG